MQGSWNQMTGAQNSSAIACLGNVGWLLSRMSFGIFFILKCGTSNAAPSSWEKPLFTYEALKQLMAHRRCQANVK